jgi:hypothetical protein
MLGNAIRLSGDEIPIGFDVAHGWNGSHASISLTVRAGLRLAASRASIDDKPACTDSDNSSWRLMPGIGTTCPRPCRPAKGTWPSNGSLRAHAWRLLGLLHVRDGIRHFQGVFVLAEEPLQRIEFSRHEISILRMGCIIIEQCGHRLRVHEEAAMADIR